MKTNDFGLRGPAHLKHSDVDKTKSSNYFYSVSARTVCVVTLNFSFPSFLCFVFDTIYWQSDLESYNSRVILFLISNYPCTSYSANLKSHA